ncbi:hypothetical protein IEQ34_012929 [Dendrobium chrysotoxum]|uniref:Uncharacterized protein n=1 Tax=Dendrobium chrysotoxum TaxID=161865 RepID=A0AAV7GPL3_DENCH|nr:hypothetical protein IEQ34_012929 [Dendrobium chrysotoxum]
MSDHPNNDFNNPFQLSVDYEKKTRGKKMDEFVPFYIVGFAWFIQQEVFSFKVCSLFLLCLLPHVAILGNMP